MLFVDCDASANMLASTHVKGTAACIAAPYDHLSEDNEVTTGALDARKHLKIE